MRKQIIAIGIVTAVAQFAAFVKLSVTARLFGVGAELDGYNLALVAPTLLSGVLSAMLQTGLFPVRARLAVEKDAQNIAAFERAVLVGLLLLGVSVSIALCVARPLVESWVAAGATPAVLDSLRLVWPFATSLVAFNAVGDGLSYLLALRNRYLYAAAAPIANALVGTIILLVWSQGGVTALAFSTVAGLGIQVLICASALPGVGFSILGQLPPLGETRRSLSEMARLGTWILPGTAFSNLTVALPAVLLAGHGEGAVAAFGYAQRFHSMTIQLLILAASPLILARLSEWVGRGEETLIAQLLAKAGRLSLVIGIASCFAIWMVGPQLLSWLFSGRFDDAAADRVGQHWLWLTIGLAPAIWGNVVAKLWQARGRAAQLSMLAGFGLATFVASIVAGTPQIGELAIPAGLTISVWAIAAVFWGMERRRTASARTLASRFQGEA